MGYAQPKVTVVYGYDVLTTTSTVFPCAIKPRKVSAKVEASNNPYSDLAHSEPKSEPKKLPNAVTPTKRKTLAVDLLGLGTHWVVISKLIEYTGYTDDAIRAKKQRGEWKEGVHWRKGPDNRLMFNLVAIQKWMGGQYA